MTENILEQLRKIMQLSTISPLELTDIISNKKASWKTRWCNLVLKSPGDRIPTCDLVLPKNSQE